MNTIKHKLKIIAAGIVLTAFGVPALAFAAPPEKTDGFVCPVIKTSAVMNSPRGMEIGGGHYTIIGPNVHVPVHATNADGTGTPAGPHSMPGDTDYTAIWATE